MSPIIPKPANTTSAMRSGCGMPYSLPEARGSRARLLSADGACAAGIAENGRCVTIRGVSLIGADSSANAAAVTRAQFIRQALPPEGLFAGQSWRISPDPFPLSKELVGQLEWLGRVLLQFHRAVNLLYRQSGVAKQP